MSEYNEVEEKMQKSIGVYVDNLASIRAGRANPAILNKVTVEYYGVETPMTQVASISIPEARLIVIQPWDKSILKEIEKAIQKADIGINPINDGNVIRLSFPELTEDRRKDLTKEIKKIAEDAKIYIRNIRREYIDVYKTKQKSSEITEDDLKLAEEGIQKLTDKYISNIDEELNKKEKEIMSI